MTMLYPNLCYSEVCYNRAAQCILSASPRSLIKNYFSYLLTKMYVMGFSKGPSQFSMHQTRDSRNFKLESVFNFNILVLDKVKFAVSYAQVTHSRI